MVRLDGFYEFGFGANVRLQPITPCRLPTHRALQGSIFTIYVFIFARTTTRRKQQTHLNNSVSE